jgi:hypothetical protein
LNQLGGLTWVVDDVRAILKQCGAPSSWGDNELNLIRQFMCFPFVFDAVSKSHRRDRAETVLRQWRTDNALRWAKMFADAPRTMIHALPQIEALLDTFSGETRSQKKRLRNVCQEVVFHYAMRNEIGRHTGNTFSKRFWSDKADALALECSKRLGLPVTAHIIEDARAEIRRRLK